MATKNNRVPVILSVSGGYYDMKGQINAYERWLTLRNIEHTFMLEDAFNHIPYVVLMAAADATAFKLRFGL